jgi:hypothetical protein
MQQRSKFVLAALAAGALGIAATAFAHPGDHEGGGKRGAEACPMHGAMQQDGHRMGQGTPGTTGQGAAEGSPMHTAMQQGGHRMGQGGPGQMEHRGMGQGMRQGPAQAAPAPQAEEEHKH